MRGGDDSRGDRAARWLAATLACAMLGGCAANGDSVGYAYEPTEACNGWDDDGDGEVDLDGDGAPLLEDCSNACGDGYAECVDGQWAYCSAPQPSDEVCNGIDDDCDGDVDEGCECVHGATRPCSSGERGSCADGTQACSGGEWSPCLADADISDRTEVCDGRDNDCDGWVDEGRDCPCEAETILGHIYLFCLEEAPWEEARDYCAGRGMRLASIETSYENLRVGQEAFDQAATYWWLGLHDTNQEGVFRWAGSGREPSFTSWAETEPNDGGDEEDCVTTGYAFIGGWNDDGCWKAHPFICEE